MGGVAEAGDGYLAASRRHASRVMHGREEDDQKAMIHLEVPKEFALVPISLAILEDAGLERKELYGPYLIGKLVLGHE